ncbi:hypothetical protein BMJ34_16025 [Sinorhizobium medicae]|nr:hypothetical protein BMJ34_16025 [Sinorhizobium medicae]
MDPDRAYARTRQSFGQGDCSPCRSCALQCRQRHVTGKAIPGIGPVAALTLIAHMPELGNRSAKAIAALAGLAPFNVDSGTSRGKRHIRGGRKRIRDALYMAALTASRMPRAFKSHADQMKEAGKPFKVVIIALARKLLAIANAIIRDKTTFRRTT